MDEFDDEDPPTSNDEAGSQEDLLGKAVNRHSTMSQMDDDDMDSYAVV